MRSTPLTDRHIALGAKMAAFAGYNMPISYTTISQEHQAVREKAGIFDVSHMGEFIVRGREALAFLQMATSNDVSKLQPGDIQYSCMPNATGGIVDDLLVYRLDDVEAMTIAGEQSYMLVVNASNEEKDWNHLEALSKGFDVRMQNISEKTGLIAVQGPLAIEILQTLTDVDLAAIPYYKYKRGHFAGCDNILLSATGYTGSGGFEIYARNEQLPLLWDAVMEAGKEKGLLPCGLGARDTLRLEKGFCLYGNDIDDTTNPLEAGLGWITKLNKGADFVGIEAARQLKINGLSRKLAGFTVQDRRVPRHHYPIENAEGEVIGTVTSGTHSPSLDKPIGMGYVSKAFSEPGSTIFIVAGGGKRLEATVCKVPFL